MNTTDYTWNGLNLKLKGLVEAREYLRQFKDMSVVIRLDNLKDFELLTKAKFKMHGLKRIGKPANFIPIIDSIIDKRSDWITGQTFYIDGGLSNIK